MMKQILLMGLLGFVIVTDAHSACFERDLNRRNSLISPPKETIVTGSKRLFFIQRQVKVVSKKYFCH